MSLRPQAPPRASTEGTDDVVASAADEYGGMVFRWLSPPWP
jgi:hypothetical protein